VETGYERIVIVLGVDHRLQGAEKRERNVVDTSYEKLIEHFRTAYGVRVDTIFQEASELGLTAAQKMANRLGLPYHDVDPHEDKRYLYGLSRDTGGSLDKPYDFAAFTRPAEQFSREDFWVRRIRATSFRVGLMICGFLHILSFAGRLIASGFEVHANYYMPLDKLCSHQAELTSTEGSHG
jgi:hypothetical protein